MTETRPKFSESPTDTRSVDGDVNASPPCDSDVLSASQTGYAKKGFNMMAPEEKLKHYDNRAQAHEDNQEDLVRCVALTRLIHGKGHLKLAQAHARLAKAYFQFKGWGLQAQEHSALARELLPFCSSMSSCKEEKLEVLRVYKRQNRPTEALSQCEKSLQLLMDCGQPDKTSSVYRDMAAIEQDIGHLDQAHAIAMSHNPEELEGAQISHSLALILSAAAEPDHNDSAGHYFELSLNAYRNSAGPQDPAFLAAQDDFCRFLLFNGQQERCVEIQRASLATKKSTFGDLSAEVADTLQLIGSVEMTEGRMKQAHRMMTKCLEIQSLLYGPQHKKTKATQKAVDMLARTSTYILILQAYLYSVHFTDYCLK
ncbi:Tetratricopeptide repeat protein 23 [Collichthys lucidus]|uniref:Tetratricopeptide repeat protein 23 n=1 Tax=Collichthys lucidus TaxID=240159 RepID=A0A4V6XYK6_COLLU|nr:Tetratricopeptide repeat protein 23 [Collichthys lucidus]